MMFKTRVLKFEVLYFIKILFQKRTVSQIEKNNRNIPKTFFINIF
jgi:hypothetical protein